MTAAERNAIETLRGEVHDYHCEVKEAVARFEGVTAKVEKINATMYGCPGKENTHPGLVGDVAELKSNQNVRHNVLRGAWAVVLIVLGVVAGRIF